MMGAATVPSAAEVEGFFDTQLAVWDDARERHKALDNVLVRKLDSGILLQYNPARIVSTAANVDKKAVAGRPCFLCKGNRPAVQGELQALLDVEVLVNPFPILKRHLTLPLKGHTPQRLEYMFHDMLALAKEWQKRALFYNGARCGASAPDHAHLQSVLREDIPLLGGALYSKLQCGSETVASCCGAELCYCPSYVVPLFLIKATGALAAVDMMGRLLGSLPVENSGEEPMVNMVAAYSRGEGWTVIVFPRAKHRPACYSAEGEACRLVSPGLLDVAGVVVTVRREDFDALTDGEVEALLREVALDGESCREVCKKIAAE